MERPESRRILDLRKSFESENVHFVSVAAVRERHLGFDLRRRNEAHRLEVGVESVDDGQLPLEDVLDDVAHGDVVRHADVVADDLESPFAGDRRHFRRQPARDAEAGAARGEPEIGAVAAGRGVFVVSGRRLAHLDFGRGEMRGVIPVDDLDGMAQGGLAEVPILAVVESAQEMQHFRHVDVGVVVDVAEPPLFQVFQERVELGRHLAAQRLAVVRGAAVGVDEPVGRKSPGQLGVVGVREEVRVVADEGNPSVQQNRQTRLVELGRRFNCEQNVFQFRLGDLRGSGG